MLDENVPQNIKRKEILKVIKYDVECLVMDLMTDENQYHYDLIMGNLNKLIKDENGYEKSI